LSNSFSQAGRASRWIVMMRRPWQPTHSFFISAAPAPLAGGLGGTLETGRTLNYLKAGNDNRKMCSLYLSLMDRFGIKLEQFGDADTRLERL
jgi:hypothetical protein